MSWHGVAGAHTAALAGNDAILAPWPTLYFDNRQSALPTEPPGRLKVVSLEDVYGFEPHDAALNDSQRHHVLGIQANLWTEHIQTEERVQWMALPRAAAVAELGWSAPLRRDSDDLELCSDAIGLLLEPADRGNAARGARAANAPLAVDIINPCWIDRGVDLSGGPRITAAVAPLPFNYEIGADAARIRVGDARTPEGELEIHVDGCDTPARALLPLAPAAGAKGMTTLPAQRLPPIPGRHDLCLRFARPRLDPLWAIDWVETGE